MERIIAFQNIYRVGEHHTFGYIKATKCALVIREIIKCDIMSEPMIPFTSKERKHVETILNNLPSKETKI